MRPLQWPKLWNGMCIFWFMSDYQLFGMCAFNPNVCSSYFPLFYACPTFTTGLQFRRKGHLTKQNEFLLFYLSTTSETRFFYSCSRICFQRPVFELCKIWIKKLKNNSTTEWFSAKRHKVKHRKMKTARLRSASIRLSKPMHGYIKLRST